MLLKVQETGYTGFYFRVMREGMVSKNDGLSLVQRHPQQITIAFANRIMHQDKENTEGMIQILAVGELSSNWRATFQKRLAGIETDTRERLTGDAQGDNRANESTFGGL